MSERRNGGGQAWLAGALFLALLIGALVISGRISISDPPKEVAVEVRPTPTPSPTAVLPQPLPVLDRAALIAAANAAASEFASSGTLSGDRAELTGRRFELRAPIGCAGPAAPDAEPKSGWRYDPKDESLRVFAAPEEWGEAEWFREIVGEGEIGAVEGFWIERPWLLSGGCPAAAKPSPLTPAIEGESKDKGASESKRASDGETRRSPPGQGSPIGLVQITPADAPRSLSRAGRPYTAVVKRAPETVSPTSAFTLIVTGRLDSFPGGAPIACQGDGWSSQPRCLIAARIERVSISDQSGEQLAEWRH